MSQSDNTQMGKMVADETKDLEKLAGIAGIDNRGVSIAGKAHAAVHKAYAKHRKLGKKLLKPKKSKCPCTPLMSTLIGFLENVEHTHPDMKVQAEYSAGAIGQKCGYKTLEEQDPLFKQKMQIAMQIAKSAALAEAARATNPRGFFGGGAGQRGGKNTKKNKKTKKISKIQKIRKLQKIKKPPKIRTPRKTRKPSKTRKIRNQKGGFFSADSYQCRENFQVWFFSFFKTAMEQMVEVAKAFQSVTGGSSGSSGSGGSGDGSGGGGGGGGAGTAPPDAAAASLDRSLRGRLKSAGKSIRSATISAKHGLTHAYRHTRKAARKTLSALSGQERDGRKRVDDSEEQRNRKADEAHVAWKQKKHTDKVAATKQKASEKAAKDKAASDKKAEKASREQEIKDAAKSPPPES